MPSWIVDLMTIAPALGAIVIFVGAMSALAVFIVKRLPLAKKVIHFLDDWFGEEARPGVPRRPGAMERLARIEHETTPNHGGSMNDGLRRVEAAQIAHRAENDARFTAFEARIGARIDELAAVDDALREEFDNTFNPKE